MSKAKKSVQQEVPKEYPSVKTIVLREDHPSSKAEPKGVRLGVWSYNLDSPLTLKDGDEVIIKSSFVDTNPAAQGLIVVSDEEVDALSLTTGLYWQDSGCGQQIQRFAQAEFDSNNNPVFDPGFGYVPGGPLPRMSQVLQSETTGSTPNARNYICQNTTDDFGNTVLYLNTPTAIQSGGGVVRTIGPPGAPPAYTKTGYKTAKNLRTTVVGGGAPASGMDLRVDIVAGADGIITAVTINKEFSQGYNYAAVATVRIIQDGVTDSQTAIISTTGTETDVPMALEFVPNSSYNPGSETHQWNDYTMQNAVDSLIPVSPPNPAIPGYPTVWQNPGVIRPGGVPVNELNRVSNLCQLKVQTDVTDASVMYIYSHDFSVGDGNGNGPFPSTGTPDPATQSIAKMVHSVDGGQPIFSFIRNNNWDLDASIYGGVANVPADHIEQGWIFASSVDTNPITFNGGKQPSFFRICLGVWLWVWNPGGQDGKGETFPAIQPGGGNTANNYAINLSYYKPGVALPDGSFAKSTVETINKLWALPPNAKLPEMNNFYDPQFTDYADTARAGVPPYFTPFSQGFPAPDSQFPDVNDYTPAGKRNNPAYPRSGLSGGTCVPVFFGNMPDKSSADARVRKTPTWIPFIYDSNPFVTSGSVEGNDSENFKPFRVTSTNLWTGGKDEMKDYPFAGIICQDVRGPIASNGTEFVQIVIPKIWTNGSEAKETVIPSPPKFQLTHECVLSKPFIPSAQRHMFARTYTTVLKDIPSGNVGGIDLTLKGGTFTYAGWARRLTDILNQVPPRRSAAPGVGFNGLSNNPANKFQPKNVPTYTTTRFMTDTIELGYQGLIYPSNRVGQGWQNVPNVKTVNPDGTYEPEQKSTSEQPYWLAETGQDCFRWKEGVTDPSGGAVAAATVDPGEFVQQALTVYGQNGPKYAGAESFSIIFNEVSQAFEIVQMHSNMYSPTSGAVIIRQNRTAADTLSAYGKTLGDLNISDKTGGIFITDWQPATIWHDKMNMNPNSLVHVGGNFSSGPNNFAQVGSSFYNQVDYPNMSHVSGHQVDLIPGLNITGNFISTSGIVDKRVNINSDVTPNRAGNFIGGNYQSPEQAFNLEVETDTPVTILGGTITPNDISDPFFMVELSGINRNEIYGLEAENKLISQIVGRYYSTGSYTEGGSDGSITYTHRGEDMLLSELGIRILDSKGQELDDDVLSGSSAVIIEINSTDVSLVDPQPQ